MAVRTYIPECYVDEVVPPGRDSPSDWIARTGYSAPAWALDGDQGLLGAGESLSRGDVVFFTWVERHGSVEMTIGCEGEYTVCGSVPSDINCVWDPETECLGDGLADFALNYTRFYMDDSMEVVTVDLARWDDGSEAFRFEVVDGVALFLPVTTQ